VNPLKLMNPVTVIKGAVGLAGTAVGVVETLAGGTAHLARSGLQRLNTPNQLGLDDEYHSKVAANVMNPSAPREPADLPVEPELPVQPHAPDEPPIDVVGEALARESALGDGQSFERAGFAHEPSAASRADEHGEAPFERIRREEIDEEVTAGIEGDSEDDEEAEAHLSQPLLEPGVAKALAAETEMMSRAADPNKG
jgi:hypothetical protein